MKKIIDYKLYIIFLFFSIFLFSCSQRKSVELLEQAQAIVETDPQEALKLLDSIPNPQDMDQNYYMQYIVAHVQAKYKCYKDITTDTLIFEAQRYFEDSKNYNQAALANFYIGWFNYERKLPSEALKSFLQAKFNADQSSNNRLVGHSLNNIGLLYFEQGVQDSAILNFKHALSKYEQVNNVDNHKLNTIVLLGRSYRASNEPDSAISYFNKGLKFSEKINNQTYKSYFNHNISIEYRKDKQYSKAKEYLNKAIINCRNSEDSLKMYLSFSKLYNDLHNTDSVSYYLGFIEQRLSEITYPPTLRNIYGELHNYYKQNGNSEKALHYKTLHAEIDKQIQKGKSADQLAEASAKHAYLLKYKELKAKQEQYIILGISAIFLVLVISYFRYRQLEFKFEEEKLILEAQNKLLEIQNESINQEIQSLLFMQDSYQNLLHEWTDLEEQTAFMMRTNDINNRTSVADSISKLKEHYRQTAKQQCVEWIKLNLHKDLIGQVIIDTLEDDELIILLLRYCRYSADDISILIGFGIDCEDVDIQIEEIKSKLLIAGVSEKLVYKFLSKRKYLTDMGA